MEEWKESEGSDGESNVGGWSSCGGGGVMMMKVMVVVVEKNIWDGDEKGVIKDGGDDVAGIVVGKVIGVVAGDVAGEGGSAPSQVWWLT